MRHIATAFALAALLPLAACSDSGTTEPEVDATGMYTLQTINGAALPFALPVSPTDTITFVEGSIHLSADGTFEDRALIRFTVDDETREDEDIIAGSWAQNGAVVILTTQGGSYSVELQADLLHMTIDTYSFVYRRQD
jgi:hypothetical protein